MEFRGTNRKHKGKKLPYQSTFYNQNICVFKLLPMIKEDEKLDIYIIYYYDLEIHQYTYFLSTLEI